MSHFERVCSVLSSLRTSVSIDKFQLDSRLSEDLGIDSLKMIMLVIKLEKEFGKKVISTSNIANVSTIQDICTLI